MPVRRPNLLDAFRRAHDVPAGAGGQGSAAPKPGEAPRASAPGAPAAAARTNPAPAASVPPPTTPKPVASGAAAPAHTPAATDASAHAPLRAAVPPAPATRIDPPAARPGSPPRERLLVLALLLAVATLALVMLLRRDSAPEGSTDTVQAATPAATTATPAANPAATNPAAPKPGSVPGRSPQDDALYDARNRYTVRLIQYPNDAQGVALATEAYRWLVKNGYPAGSPILLGSGKGLVLVASAKPTQEELIPLRDNLRRLRYPTSSKTMPFSDAYIVQIDDVLAR